MLYRPSIKRIQYVFPVVLSPFLFKLHTYYIMGPNWLSWLGVGLVTNRSLVQLPVGALWSVLRQDNFSHIDSVYPAAQWVPSINNAVLRACALYACQLLWNIPRGIKMVSVCKGLLGEEGRVSASVDTRL